MQEDIVTLLWANKSLLMDDQTASQSCMDVWDVCVQCHKDILGIDRNIIFEQ